MFELSTLIITGLACLIIGLAAGAQLVRVYMPAAPTLENQLEDAETKLSDYQNDVSEHFAETSRLVNNLTQSYKEVLLHQAQSALKLSNQDISKQLIEAAEGNLALTESMGDIPLEQPKDWAPQTGQLREEFGLEKSS